MTYEFQCPYGHITEKEMSIKTTTSTIECVACGEEAIKIISLNPNRPVGLPTKVHHKTGATEAGKGPIDLGEIG